MHARERALHVREPPQQRDDRAARGRGGEGLDSVEPRVDVARSRERRAEPRAQLPFPARRHAAIEHVQQRALRGTGS
jgi:hypothetical protein